MPILRTQPSAMIRCSGCCDHLMGSPPALRDRKPQKPHLCKEGQLLWINDLQNKSMLPHCANCSPHILTLVSYKICVLTSISIMKVYLARGKGIKRAN